ncbi:DUF397 domain-containing protein [Actinocorallia sp. B10E7]|uniref:DUF397 domain-containing protein n=1 Tax=Actinocorallia sp. B10E7 TaxID=3153558 RepID=UPI00325F774E
MTSLVWRKSSYSNASSGDCVETARLGHELVGLRDSKHTEAGHLTVPASQFAALLRAIKAGEGA